MNGKSKIDRQVHLGKAEDLVVATEQPHPPPQPLETEVAAFGDAAAWFDIAQHPITAEHVLEFEKQMAQRLADRFQLDPRALIYDGASFFGYINTRNSAELPQRGHKKRKRGDLRQVSLGQLVSADSHVPLFHRVHAANLNDSTEFRSIPGELPAHYRQLADSRDYIALVFNKGNSSWRGS